MDDKGLKYRRLQTLDSFRALAALFVMGYHFFYRWTQSALDEPLLKSSSIFSDLAIFRAGFLGVEFFFIISGFVIALTLTNTTSVSEFTVKRFSRLFPAMLVCSLITFLVSYQFAVAPLNQVEWKDFLPSLTFVSPQIWNKLFNLDTSWVSGVHWSLFIEIKFYAVAACLYFIDKRGFLRNMTVACAGMVLLYHGLVFAGQQEVAEITQLILFPDYAAYFLAGILFYVLKFENHENQLPLLLGVFICFAYSSFTVYSASPQIGLQLAFVVAVFFALFLCFQFFPGLLAPLDRTPLPLIGAASYSLYLVHETLGVTLIHKLQQIDALAVLPVKLMTALVLVIVSIWLFKAVEIPGKNILMRGSRWAWQKQQ